MPISAKQRQSLADNEFGDPATRTFPVRNQSDLDSAAHLVGKAKDPEAVKRRLIRIAKRKGLTIPDAWKTEDDKAKMSALVATFKAEPHSLSHSQIRDLLSLSLGDAFEGEYCLMDVYPSYVVACEWDMGGMETNTISYTINADYSVDWGTPQCVQPETVFHPVADPDDDGTAGEKAEMAVFNLASFKSRIEGDYRIYDDANLFLIGDYPDKGFSLSDIEAETAVGSFVECPVNIHHAEELSNMFTGNLGSVRDLWVDGEWVKGEVAIPLWLDNQLTDDGKKLSAEWTLTDKRFVGLALTPTPRIEAAALMAAFKNSGKSQSPVPAATSKECGIPERNTLMSFVKDMAEAITAPLAAFFAKKGINIDEELPDVTPATKVTETAEFKAQQTELAKYKAIGEHVIQLKRAEAEKAAVAAFGQDTAKLKTAKTVIDATEDINLLDSLTATYFDLKPQVKGGRQTFSTKQQEAIVPFHGPSAIAALPEESQREMVAAFSATGSERAIAAMKLLKEQGVIH